MNAHQQKENDSRSSVEETIAAISHLGDMLHQLRLRLGVAERTIASLEAEKLMLQRELSVIGGRGASTSTMKKQTTTYSSSDEELATLIRGIDTSFVRSAA